MVEQTKLKFEKPMEGPGPENRTILSYFNPFYGRITLTQLLLFTKYFATLTKAGVSVVRSLITLSRQMVVWRFRKIIWELKESVEGGMPLHLSFRKNEETFGLLYINLIKTGEESGRLYTVLERLCTLVDRQIKLRRKVISALFYPAIIAVVASLVITFLMLWVIPQFSTLFKQFNQELPGPTRFIIASSEFFVSNYLNLIAGTLGFFVILYQVNQSSGGRFFLDGLKLKIPVFGDLIRKYNIAQFSRNLAILYKSGVSIIPAIKTSIDSIENMVLADALSKVARDVEGGVPVAASIQRVDVMPEIALQMIEVGEEAGNLDDMLERVADFYEEEINYLVDALTALIEPAFIVVLGSIVGTIVMAMYLPIFKMAKVITGGANAPSVGTQ